MFTVLAVSWFLIDTLSLPYSLLLSEPSSSVTPQTFISQLVFPPLLSVSSSHTLPQRHIILLCTDVTFETAELTGSLLWSLLDISSWHPFWQCRDDTMFYSCSTGVKGLLWDWGCIVHQRQIFGFLLLPLQSLSSSKSLTLSKN